MKKLEFLIGKFSGQLASFRNGTKTREVKTDAQGEWAAEGEFVILRLKTPEEAVGRMVILGYDPQKKTYQSWLFVPRRAPDVGHPIEGIGVVEGSKLVLSDETDTRSVLQPSPEGGYSSTTETKRDGRWVKVAELVLKPVR